MDHRNSFSLLLEMILAVLLFAVCAAVSLTMFARAREITAESEEKTQAAAYLENCSEILHASADKDAFLTSLQQLHPQAEIHDLQAVLYTDASFQDCAESNAVYVTYIQLNEDTPYLIKAEMTCQKKDTVLYEETSEQAVGGAQ